MKEMRRISGFMPMARDVISETPGLTAQEVFFKVAQFAAEKGIRLSAAVNPEASLVATLHKSYKDFGLERVHAPDGRLRYYLSGQAPREDLASQPFSRSTQQKSQTVDLISSEETIRCIDGCCIEPLSDDSMAIDLLVTRGLYSDEHAAHRDLVSKGLEVVFGRLKTAI